MIENTFLTPVFGSFFFNIYYQRIDLQTNPDSFTTLFLPQNVHLLPREQDVLLSPGHQPPLPPYALPWQKDCSGHSRRCPRHQPAGCKPGPLANTTRLPAPDRPHQL